MIYYVNQKAELLGDGSAAHPFAAIGQAAAIAKAGDEVLVAPGVYREAVHPLFSGTEEHPIVYRSEQPLAAVITGAEEIKTWKKTEGTVWKAVIPNRIFGDRNPYTTRVAGDWFIESFLAHTGDVYLNDKSMYEVTDRESVENPVRSKASWDPEFSLFVWYSEQDSDRDATVIYANFQGLNPNEEKVEISVRKNCFWPEKNHVDFITVSGFTICKAATQWAPPTAYQEGMIGPNWAKNWVIEDCEIYESKCSGISLGKYYQAENDNKWTKTKYKDGTQTERECICQAQREGWTKEQIGHHTVRRCHIHDCGQTGIVGHLGGVFSLIEENHIHNINNKQNLAGAEIGGIKMHAAIDVIFRKNHIHHCTRGLWLDWQAQGTRVTQNFFHDNTLPTIREEKEVPKEMFLGCGEDIFVEVSHGPTLIDNNILLSWRAFKFPTQGVAVVHNLIGGAICAVGRGTDNGTKVLPSPRYTPYHVPHRTEIAGFMTFLHGDMRFYNNIFIQQKVPSVLKEREAYSKEHFNTWDDNRITAGLSCYEGYPTFEEWNRMFADGEPVGERYYEKLPVWAGGNLYLNGAEAWGKEKEAFEGKEEIRTILTQEKGKTGLSAELQSILSEIRCPMIATETLGMAFEPEERFENPDGTEILFDTAYDGAKRTEENAVPGPFII